MTSTCSLLTLTTLQVKNDSYSVAGSAAAWRRHLQQFVVETAVVGLLLSIDFCKSITMVGGKSYKQCMANHCVRPGTLMTVENL